MSLMSVEDRIAKALADQEVALWLGTNWSWEVEVERATVLAGQNWLGIWSESRDPELGQFLEKEWRDRPFGRTFTEVPDQVHEALDREFLYSRICPLFYLAGRGPARDNLSKRTRLLTRAAKIEQLERLGAVYLLIERCSTADDLGRLLTDDLETARDRLRRILVTGVDDLPRWQAALAGQVPPEVLERIDLYPDTLPVVLERIAAKRRTYEEANEHVLLVGPNKLPIPLTALLHTDPPIDQYFHVLTGKDLRPAEAEDPEALLVDLLSGRAPPWRALRHELHWRRPAMEYLSRKVVETLEHMKQRPGVVCVDIEGESGSGLSTALQILAFDVANHGFPTLIARGGAAVKFDVLRTFLVNLERRLTEQKLAGVPTVVVLDFPECEHDPHHVIELELPRLLRRESRRVLLVRGTGNRDSLRTPDEMLARFEPPRFKRVLDSKDLDSLIDDWVRPVYGRVIPDALEEKIKDVRQWAAEAEGNPEAPLLACLYLILNGNERLRHKVNLGKHLLARLARQLVRRPARSEPSQPLRGGLGSARFKFDVNTSAGPPMAPSPQDMARTTAGAAVAVLASLGQFRQAVPRAVLQNLLGIDSAGAYRLIDQLQQSDLVWADLLTDFDDGERPDRASRLMPTSYYRDLEPVGLIHSLYGRMLLESLTAGTTPFEHLRAESPLADEVFAAYEEVQKSAHPVRLFRPIFRRLQAGLPSHRLFAEDLSMQFLRERESDTGPVPPPDAMEILDAHAWLPAAMVEHSGPMLHSRALAQKPPTAE